MRSRIVRGVAVMVALFGVAAVGLFGAASAGAAPSGSAYTCTGGNFTGDPSTSTFTTIPPGNYASITIAGVCNVQADAMYNISGNLNVAPGALFDAQDVASTITIGHNVTAGAGSFLGTVLYRRRSVRNRTRVDVYFDDGSMVSLAAGSPDADAMLPHAEEVLAAAREGA